MKRIVTLLVLGAVALAAAGTVTGSTERKASLRLLDTSPLVVRGASFVPRERIRVTATVNDHVLVRRTRAGALGGFTVGFGEVDYDRCGSPLVVAARGSEGSSAALKRPQPLCPPPLSP